MVVSNLASVANGSQQSEPLPAGHWDRHAPSPRPIASHLAPPGAAPSDRAPDEAAGGAAANAADGLDRRITRASPIGTVMMRNGEVTPVAYATPDPPMGIPLAEVVLDPTANCRRSWIPCAPHAYLQVGGDHFHALKSHDPVWRVPGELDNGTERIRLRDEIAVALRKVLDIWAPDYELRQGKRSYWFNAFKAIVAFFKPNWLTRRGKRKIVVAYLYTALVSRVDPYRSEGLIDGVRQRYGRLSSIFCGSFVTRMLQLAWLTHEAEADARVGKTLEGVVKRLQQQYYELRTSNIQATKARRKLNRHIWQCADQIMRQPGGDILADMPVGLRTNAGSAPARAAFNRLLASTGG